MCIIVCYVVCIIVCYPLVTYKGIIANPGIPRAVSFIYPKGLKWIWCSTWISHVGETAAYWQEGELESTGNVVVICQPSTSFNLSQLNILRHGVFTYKVRRKRNRLIYWICSFLMQTNCVFINWIHYYSARSERDGLRWSILASWSPQGGDGENIVTAQFQFTSSQSE